MAFQLRRSWTWTVGDKISATAHPAPNGPLEIVFLFDTTYLMYGYLEQVRANLKDMIQRLQSDIPGIRIALFAYGDYTTHITKWEDFSDDPQKLCKFVSDMKRTHQGNALGHYECVLRQVRTELSWTPGSRRALVMVGSDDVPREASFPIDWREEVKELAEMGVTVYCVQCTSRRHATNFYRTISTATGVKHLQLGDPGGLCDVIMGVCYTENDDITKFHVYEQEARSCGGEVLRPDVDNIFKSLRNAEVSPTTPPRKNSAAVIAQTPAAPKKKFAKKPSVHVLQGLNVRRALYKPRRKRRPTRKVKSRKLAVSALGKYHLRNLPLLKRENVPETNFSLRNLAWTPWVPAIVPGSTDTDKLKGSWKKCHIGEILRHRQAHRILEEIGKLISLPQKTPVGRCCPTLYEVAVQAPGLRKRRRVMYSMISSRPMTVSNWESRLFTECAKFQVATVVSFGCRVLVRSCRLLGSKADVASVKGHLRRYDYAWCRMGLGARTVVDKALILSLSHS